LLTTIVDARAEPSQRAPQVGDAYEITLTRDSSQRSNDGLSEGSSHDQDTIIERVIGVRQDGLELEYDFPKDTPKDQKDSNWQFPARVFRPFQGSTQLLDRADVEKRVDAWLRATKWTRTICGHWIFTWNAFRIECDPDSVIKAVEAFELPADVNEGAAYRDARARGPGILAKKASTPSGARFATEMEIDADAIRRERAESDVAVGEVMNKPVTLEGALNNHAKDMISGTISVTFDTDSQGNVWRRTKITKLEIKTADGKSETDAVTETLERRTISRH
jgi:hypothetical protein